MKIRLIAALLLACAAAPLSAANLNEPPYFSQLKTCYEGVKTYGSAAHQTYLIDNCGRTVCFSSKPCCEYFCQTRPDDKKPSTEQCMAGCNPYGGG